VRRKLRAVGWGLIILFVVAIAVIVIAGAIRAHTDAEFNRSTGWATIWAVPLAALGIVFIAFDKITGSDRAPGQGPSTAKAELPATCPLAPGRPLMDETDPFAFEVHRPVEPDVGTSRGLPPLPQYVRRTHDEELARVTQAAVEGRSGIAALVGGSSTGKTRACWETLQIIKDTAITNASWRLWHPIAPSHTEAVLKDLPNVTQHTVIWLNEAQLFLDASDGEEVAAALRELLRDAKRAPILVLATLWPEHWSNLTTRPAGYRAPDPHAQARELLAGCDINVPSAFNTMELRELADADDPRLVQAAAYASHGEIAQYLASAPELLSRYMNAPPAPKALIHAAMDARRLGVGDSIPLKFLKDAATAYLTDGEWNSLKEDWLPNSLAQIAESGKGTLAPLTLIRRRPGHSSLSEEKTYRLADYLNQHSHHIRRTIIPPLGFWGACETLNDRVELGQLGNAAEARGILLNAARLHKRAAVLGDAKAAGRLVKRLNPLDPDTSSAARQLIDNVSFDEIDAVSELAHALEAAGAAELTTSLLKSVMKTVPLDSPRNLALLLKAARQANADETNEECIAVLLARDPAAHARLDDLPSVAELIKQLWLGQGREQAMSLARRTAAAAAIDEVDGVCELVEVLRRMEGTEPLAALLARAPALHVPLNDLLDLVKLLTSLYKAGAEEQVAALGARIPALSVDRDNLEDLATRVDELWESGAKEQAAAIVHHASTCAGPHDPEASVLVANMLVTVEAEEFEPALLDRCPVEFADLTEVSAVFALLQALWESGAVEEVEALLARDPAMSVACDNSWDVARLLNLFCELRAEQVEPGAEQQIAMLLARDPGTLVALDVPASVADLLKAMRNAGAVEQVKALAKRAAEECGNLTTGSGSLLSALRDVGAEAEAKTLVNRLPEEECFESFLLEGDNKHIYQFGRKPDGAPMDRWGWEDLDLSRPYSEFTSDSASPQVCLYGTNLIVQCHSDLRHWQVLAWDTSDRAAGCEGWSASRCKAIRRGGAGPVHQDAA
jgi:hypothetical protein